MGEFRETILATRLDERVKCDRRLGVFTALLTDWVCCARVRVWRCSKPPAKLFDLIIAGDVVYLKEHHSALLATMRRWLAPNGTALLVCSRRQGSLNAFTEMARQSFTSVSSQTDYSPEVVATFDGEKCYPVLTTLKGHGNGGQKRMAGQLIGETCRSRQQAEPRATERERTERLDAERTVRS